MWYIGTRFTGRFNFNVNSSTVCIVNYVDDRNMGFIVVPRSFIGLPVVKKPSSTNPKKWCDQRVKAGNWVILSQPFEAYLNQIEQL